MANVSEICAVPLAEGFNQIFLPWEHKKIVATKRAQEGIPIGKESLRELNEIAASFSIEQLKSV